MSSDYYVVDDKSRTYMRLGQRYANGNTWFGLSRDDERGRRKVADYITDHIDYESHLRIVLTDEIPEGYSNYEWGNRFYLERRDTKDSHWIKEESSNNFSEILKLYFACYSDIEIGETIEYCVFDENTNKEIPHEELVRLYNEIQATS